MKPVFRKVMFWDVDFDKIDYDKYANWVIERVFERGDIEDIRQCRRYYGDEKVREAMLHAKFIQEHIMYFTAAVINEKVENFRCYTLRQLNPELYPY